MTLDQIGTSVETLPGVGQKTARLFAKLGIFTVADLLSTYPKSYEDRTRRIPLADFELHPKVHTICKVTAHEYFGYGRMKTLKIAVTDGTAQAWLVAFNRGFLKDTLPEGSIVAVTGKFEVKYGSLQSTAFEAERITSSGNLSDYADASVPGSGVISCYPLTEGLSQKNFRKAIAAALRQYGKSVDDELPAAIIADRHLLHKKDALTLVHRPESMEQAEEARHTLIYEELYQFEYKLSRRAYDHRGTLPDLTETGSTVSDGSAAQEVSDGEFLHALSPLQRQLVERLGFPLTPDQKRAVLCMSAEIDRSETERNTLLNTPQALERNPFAMQRLLQGDVGAGKTLVAFLVCLRVIDYGGQCAIMAPTELLARQHAENAARQLEALGVRVAFLTGNIKSSGRAPLLDALKKGELNLVIGTHALFSRSTVYHNLRLAVIDEQHRFGVTQRESIIAKGRITRQTEHGELSLSPSVLMMSATPIPQTLALTAFGDLDVSVIKTLPQGRKPVRTYLSVMGNERNAYNAVRKELQQGHQAYFVYPRIAEGEDGADTAGLKSAEEMFSMLSKEVYPEFSCALIHSKIDEAEQSRILDAFRDGKIQLLVATTVVEVGVDVSNATCIVIEHADRFGLAELHQLRGRVGRGSSQSYCFLIYGKNISEDGKARMKALHESTDGFVIAEQDLALRGPGQVTGTAQSGYLTLGIADLQRDKDMLIQARCDAVAQIAAELQAT